jgi:N-acetyl-D-muramate 6-phosphate phosphatase
LQHQLFDGGKKVRQLIKPAAVLFDLDGTLLDSAPDLLAALTHVRHSLGLQGETPVEAGQFVSAGAAAMLRAGLPVHLHEQIPVSRDDFLRYYEAHICVHSKPYPGVLELLVALQKQSIAWGIVTNKPFYLAEKLIQQLGWQPGALLGGDSLLTKKPDGAPILEACKRLGVGPEQTWMVGDDPRDIEAGKNANCALTIACAYGYMGDAPPVALWGADQIVSSVIQLNDLLL